MSGRGCWYISFCQLDLPLKLVASSRGTFDDRPAEIQNYIYLVNDDISHLNNDIAQLQDLSKRGDSVSGKGDGQVSLFMLSWIYKK